MYSAHPYVFYQRARILKELRQDHIIGDEYNHLIKSNYDSCLMMINSPSFAQIKTQEHIHQFSGYMPCSSYLVIHLNQHLIMQMTQ